MGLKKHNFIYLFIYFTSQGNFTGEQRFWLDAVSIEIPQPISAVATPNTLILPSKLLARKATTHSSQLLSKKSFFFYIKTISHSNGPLSSSFTLKKATEIKKVKRSPLSHAISHGAIELIWSLSGFLSPEGVCHLALIWILLHWIKKCPLWAKRALIAHHNQITTLQEARVGTAVPGLI